MGRSKTGRSSLARSAPKGRRPAGRRFYVYCEGERSEPEYLLGLREALRTRLLHVEIVRKGAAPSTLVASAVAKARELRRARETDDEVWVLFDRDEHPDWHKALDQAQANRIPVAYSNPCFELWLLLHYREWTSPLDRHQARSALQEHLRHYDKGVRPQDFFDDLLTPSGELTPDSRCLRATQRAKALAARAADCGGDGNPTSEIWQLVERILRQR